MSLLAAMADSARADVQVGEIWYRVHRITTAELVEAGGGVLLAARPPTNADAPPDPRQVADQVRMGQATVIAGLRAVSRDGANWEEVTLVADPKKEAPAAGRLYIGSLLPDVVAVLTREILTLSMDGGAAAERLASFLGANARAPRRAR